MWQRRPSVSGNDAEELGRSQAGRSTLRASGPSGASVVGILLAFPCLVYVGVLFRHGQNGSSSSSSSFSPSLPQRALDSLTAFPNLFFWNLKGTAEVLIKEQAVIVGIPPARVGALFDTLDPVTDALGVTADVKGFNAAWEGFWLRNGRTCLAHDAKRLKEAVESPACDVVLLLPGHVYNLKKMINVRKPITLIGNPAERPIINAADAERAFWAHSGASMDIRHIMFYEGNGDLIRNGFRTRFGGVIYLSRGANTFLFDCLFTIQPQREAIINNTPEFIFGGDILMEGGMLNALACSFFAIVPGFINSISTEVGGSVLILGGTATFTLVNFMTTQIFAFNAGGGMHLALLGGALSMQGCTHTANLVFALQGIVGRNIFVEGGIAVFAGVAVTDSICFLAFYGAGFSIFIGGGGAIFTGCEITLNSAISHKAGVGVAVAVGVGMGLFYGTVFSKNLGISLFNTLGVFIFVGAGHLALIGCSFAHQNAIVAWQLLGGAVYLGAGQAVMVGCAFARSLGLDFFTGLGGDLFIGAGQLVLVKSVFTSNTGITVFLGQGTELYLAAGSAFIKHLNFSINSGVHLVSKGLMGFYVAGRKCEVLTLESEEILKFKEKGYGLCYKGFGGNEKEEGGEEEVEGEGEGQAVVVVQSLHGRQQLGGWRGLTPLDTSPARMYLGGNISSCAMCGLDNVEVQGPGTEVCADGGATATAACPAISSPVVVAAATASMTTSSTTTTPVIKNKFFGLGGRLRRLVMGEGEDDGKRQAMAEDAAGAAAGAIAHDEYDPDAPLPDTYIIIADLILDCSSSSSSSTSDKAAVGAAGGGCGTSAGDLQDLLEESWLKALGVEDDARLYVTAFKSSESLLETLGVPSFDSSSSSSTSSSNSNSSSSSSSTASASSPVCAAQDVYAAYLHATDKSTFETLKRSLLSTNSSSTSTSTTLLSTRLALLLADSHPELCSLNLTLQDSFVVSAPLRDPTSPTGTTTSSSSSSSSNQPTGIDGGINLPRVWVNITTPLIVAGSIYEVAISEFDDGDLVGLQLMTSPPSKDKKNKEAPSLFFSSAPRPLHTFRPFDALVMNQTWGWRVSSLTFKGLGTGPFFLKAFDVLEPRRFVLSQAFELEGTTATAGIASGGAKTKAGGRKAQTSSTTTTTTTRAEHIVRRLSGHFSGNEEEEEKREEQGRTRKLDENDEGSSSSINLVSMMSTLLVSPKSKDAFSTTGELWKALLTLPSSQGALKNSTLARQLLERAPVLQTAPAVLALDANSGAGWKDPLRVQAAMGKAIADFMDMSLSVMQQQKGGAGAMFGQQEEQWPTKILESLTPEEEALAGRVAQEGDVESMNVLMDSQAARRFGGMTMERLKEAGVGEEIKKMLGSTALFRELIDDPELWETLGVGEVDASSE